MGVKKKRKMMVLFSFFFVVDYLFTLAFLEFG